MLEWDLGVRSVPFVKDESTHLDYLHKIRDNCHLGTILALKTFMVIECSLSFSALKLELHPRCRVLCGYPATRRKCSRLELK